MKTEDEIRHELAEIEDLVKTHGMSSDVDGMIFVLKWVVNNTVPSPSYYTKMIFGVAREDEVPS